MMNQTFRRQHNFLTVILLLTLFAFALRLARLDFQPLWGDEGWSVYFAAMPLPQMLTLTAGDIHPPLYYALLRAWFALTGTGAVQARLLSVLFGTLLVAVMYALGRRFVPGWGGGLTAAGVTAVAPMAVYYSQEVRMYGLVTLLGALSTFFFVDWWRGKRRAVWGYIIFTTLALYTMYYAAFVVAAQVVFVVFKMFPPLLRGRVGEGGKFSPSPNSSLKGGEIVQNFTPFIGAGILYLPWVIFAGRALSQYVAQKVVVESYVSLNLGQFLLAYLTAFSVGHPAAAALKPLSGAIVLLALAGTWFLRQTRTRLSILLLISLYLFIPLLLGWLVNLVNPFTPRYFERTLLIAAPAWWLLVAAGVVFLWRWRSAAGWISVVAMIVIFGASLFDFYTIPRYPDDDYRPLMAEIAARAAHTDVLLASYQWQLGFYEAYLPQPRPQIYPVPEWGKLWGRDAAAMHRDLTALLAQHAVWFPAHQSLGHLWEDRAEAVMADIGFPALLKWYNPSTKLSLVGRQASLQAGPMVNFGNHLRADISLPVNAQVESGRGIIPLQIKWTAQTANLPDYLITLKLVDARGEVWAQQDTTPRARQTSFTALAAGDSLIDRHGLLVSAGTPPGAYRLELSLTDPQTNQPLDILRDGQPQGVAAELASVTVVPPARPLLPDALARQVATAATFDHQLKLVGYTATQRTVKTGAILPVSLFWQSQADNLPNFTTFVQLQDAQGRAVALTERPPVYPTDRWQKGTLLRDVHHVRIPATLPAGTYTLAAGVLLPDKTRLTTPHGDQVTLGTVTVSARQHNFTSPRPAQGVTADFGGAALIGFDLTPTELRAGESLQLTLYWQGGKGFDRAWAIFAHMVDAAGNIWAQKDQFPGAGDFPTTAWIPDEYITDQRTISLRPDTPAGVYFVEVGLYNPNTFERVSLVGGGDVVRLDVPVIVK